MTRRYTNIRVLLTFNVSSSSHAFFTVRWDGGSREYSPQIGWFSLPKSWSDGWSQAPRYLTAAADACILRLLQSGDYRAYEYDRDGNKRYEGLRYWNDELKAEIIHLCRPAGGDE